jgi:ribosome-binding factor A
MSGRSGKGRAAMAGRPPSQRQLRVAETIRHRLSEFISRGEFDEPALNRARLTVTEVRISPDLKQATAFVMPLGGAQLDQIVRLLNEAAPSVRKYLGRDLHLRHVPVVVFKADDSFDEAAAMDKLLNSEAVRRDLDKS